MNFKELVLLQISQLIAVSIIYVMPKYIKLYSFK